MQNSGNKENNQIIASINEKNFAENLELLGYFVIGGLFWTIFCSSNFNIIRRGLLQGGGYKVQPVGVNEVQQVRVYKVSLFQAEEVGVYKVHLFLFWHSLIFFSNKAVRFLRKSVDIRSGFFKNSWICLFSGNTLL